MKTTLAAWADVKHDAKDEPPKEPKAEMIIPGIIDAVATTAGAPKKNANNTISSMKKASPIAKVDKQPLNKKVAASAAAKRKEPLMKRPAAAITAGGKPSVRSKSAKRRSPMLRMASDSKNTQAPGEPK